MVRLRRKVLTNRFRGRSHNQAEIDQAETNLAEINAETSLAEINLAETGQGKRRQLPIDQALLDQMHF